MQADVWEWWARKYRDEFGLVPLPVSPTTKHPCIKWKPYQTQWPNDQELHEWSLLRANIGVATGPLSNLVVVDCDTMDDARWFWDTQLPRAATVVRTRKGVHFYYRHPGEKVAGAQRVGGRYDVRGDGGFVVVPPSSHGEGHYRFTKQRPLQSPASWPVFDMRWRPARQHKPNRGRAAGRIRDADRYLRQIIATEGQGGDRATFNAVRALRDAGADEVEAMRRIIEWNRTNAIPPWDERDLEHKVRQVYGGAEGAGNRTT